MWATMPAIPASRPRLREEIVSKLHEARQLFVRLLHHSVQYPVVGAKVELGNKGCALDGPMAGRLEVVHLRDETLDSHGRGRELAVPRTKESQLRLHIANAI